VRRISSPTWETSLPPFWGPNCLISGLLPGPSRMVGLPWDPPQSLQWKVLKTLHQTYHLGVEYTLSLVKCMFEIVKIKETLQYIIRGCKICLHNNPHNQPLPLAGTQRWGSYPGDNWQIDFTHMPGSPCSHLLLLLVDTFTERVETFPCSTEKAWEVATFLIQEIISWFSLPHSLQRDNMWLKGYPRP
jgi:hypothetical protein